MSNAKPKAYGFSAVFVWAPQETLDLLPQPSWLIKNSDQMLEASILHRTVWQAHFLGRIARESGCSVLFVPGGLFVGDFRPFVTMSQNLLPFEATERGRYISKSKWLRLMLLRLIQAHTIARANATIFLTRYAQDIVERSMSRAIQNATIVPHGIADRFVKDPRQQRNIGSYSENNPFQLLYVSTVEYYKHQWHVVEAVGRLRNQGLPVVLDLVGAAYPPALRRLQKSVDMFDPERRFVRYHGVLPHAEMHRKYSEADLFVFASSCENLPNILIEAMGAGLPICSSDRGPMPEVLGNAGAYFDPESPSNIATVIGAAINDARHRADYANSAFAKAKHYSWSACADKTLKFLAATAIDR